MKRLNLRLLILWWMLQSAIAAAGIPPIPPEAPAAIPTPVTNLPNLPFLRPIGSQNPFSECCNASTSGSDFASTSVDEFTSVGQITQLALYNFNLSAGAGVETSGANAIVRQECLEYPIGTLISCLSVNGNTSWTESNKGSGTLTDPLGVYIPPATNFNIRVFTAAARPPSALSAAAIAGGALASGTTYYYKVTTIDSGIESSGSAEATCSPASTNLACILTITPNACPVPTGFPARPCQQNVYRATSTGAETFLATIAGAATSWIDLGYVSTAAGATPPSTALQYEWNHSGMPIGWSNNVGGYGGNQSNQVATTGAVSGASGPSQKYTYAPVILGNDTTVNGIVGIHDSIGQGEGINPSAAGFGSNFVAAKNWFDLGVVAAGAADINASIGGSQICAIVNGTVQAKARLSMIRFGSYVLSNLGTNDIWTAGLTWQQVATCHLQLAQQVKALGSRYVGVTLLPRVTSTDGLTSYANQTINGTYEPAREALNSWWRAGSPVNSSGAPVAPSTAGAVSSPYIYTYFDAAALIEVNVSGVPTLNGGYWPITGSALLTTTLTGTPTITAMSIATSATSDQYDDTVIVVGGVVGIVNRNSGSNFTVYASGATMYTGTTAGTGFASAASSGATAILYTRTSPDGIHPSLYINGLIGNGSGVTIGGTFYPSWSAFITAKLTRFQ